MNTQHVEIDRFDQTFFEKIFFAKIDLKSVQFMNLKSKKFFDQKFRPKLSVKNGQKGSTALSSSMDPCKRFCAKQKCQIELTSLGSSTKTDIYVVQWPTTKEARPKTQTTAKVHSTFLTPRLLFIGSHLNENAFLYTNPFFWHSWSPPFVHTNL